MAERGSVAEDRAVAGSITEVTLSGDEPAARIQVFPMGRSFARDGRGPWILRDRAHALEVIEATRARLGSTDFMIDYDHQADTAPRAGGQARAAGWVRPDDLVAEDDGIWAVNVQWTATAKAHLRDREYRYISPWFGFDKKTGELTRLFNAALVNTPALELAAVAAQSPPGDPQDMNITALAAALGLGEDATEDQVLAAIQELKDGAATAGATVTAATSALGLAGGATEDEITAAASQAVTRAGAVAAIATALGLPEDADADAVATAAAKAAGSLDPTKFVPIEQYNILIARAAKVDEDRATAAVAAATEAGKIAPHAEAQKWALDLFRRDEQAFASFVSFAPQIVRSGEEERKEVDGGGDKLTDEEKATCAIIGCSEADFLKTKKELAG